MNEYCIFHIPTIVNDIKYHHDVYHNDDDDRFDLMPNDDDNDDDLDLPQYLDEIEELDINVE